MMNGKNIWMEVVLVYLKYYMCLSRLVEDMKYFSQDDHSPG
jgi:hypothetical protein